MEEDLRSSGTGLRGSNPCPAQFTRGFKVHHKQKALKNHNLVKEPLLVLVKTLLRIAFYRQLN